MEYHVKINGIDVEASFLEANIEQIFLPLLDLLQRMQKEKGGRILVMLAAPHAKKQFLLWISVTCIMYACVCRIPLMWI